MDLAIAYVLHHLPGEIIDAISVRGLQGVILGEGLCILPQFQGASALRYKLIPIRPFGTRIMAELGQGVLHQRRFDPEGTDSWLCENSAAGAFLCNSNQPVRYVDIPCLAKMDIAGVTPFFRVSTIPAEMRTADNLELLAYLANHCLCADRPYPVGIFINGIEIGWGVVEFHQAPCDVPVEARLRFVTEVISEAAISELELRSFERRVGVAYAGTKSWPKGVA